MLFGVLVTFRRQDKLTEMLEAVFGQTKYPSVLFVIDNEASSNTEALVTSFARRVADVDFRYIAASENVGPAGGWALGMNHCLEECNENDWILTLDDNDPPRTPVDVESVFRMAVEERKSDHRVGGAAILGARFNWRTGILQRLSDEEICGAVPVDYVAGGKMAMYAAAAIRAAGPFAAELFYGGVEVEFGLRLRRAGFNILAHGDLWRGRRQSSKRVAISIKPDKTCVVHWQKYYRIRNYIYMMRRFGRIDLSIRWAIVQCLIKPTLSLFVSPRGAILGFVQAWRATRDGFCGNMGRTVEPPLSS